MSPTKSKALQDLIDRIAAAEDRTPASLQRMIQESDVRREDIEPFCDWDHPVDGCYGRSLVHDGGCFEVIALAWLPGDVSAIHDHGSTRWGAVQCFGPLEHAIFNLDDEARLTTVARESVPANSIVPVANELIHQMGNLGDVNVPSLHIYGCDGRTDGQITAGARVFDVDQGAIQLVDGGAFFDLEPGTYEIQRDDLRAGFATHLRHQTELVARIAHKNGAHSNGRLHCERGRRVARELFSKSLWEKAPSPEDLNARDTAILDRDVARTALVMTEIAPLLEVAADVTAQAPCPRAHGIEGFARPFVEHVTAAIA